MKTLLLTTALAFSLSSVAFAESIRVVGSSTVFPYSQAVAEEYSARTGGTSPIVESTGTGGGFKAFCSGFGPGTPDVTGASRAIKESEAKSCEENGVVGIIEDLIGYDGLSVAHSRDSETFGLTKVQLFQALSAKVEVNGQIVDNPYQNWSDIDASLPNSPIVVLGPPPTSGTRDAFVELVMHKGCEAFPAIAALEGDAKKEVCERMRQDGPYVEAGENDNIIVQRLVSDPSSVGIFGYSFLYENQDILKAVAVDGVEPTFDTISDGSYSVSRPLYIYTKEQHLGVTVGLVEFREEFLEAAAPGGYLEERGLIPNTKLDNGE
jgi:phosphate transport system substrate-binding protein